MECEDVCYKKKKKKLPDYFQSDDNFTASIKKLKMNEKRKWMKAFYEKFTENFY